MIWWGSTVRRTERVNQALLKWTVERAESDLVVAPRLRSAMSEPITVGPEAETSTPRSGSMESRFVLAPTFVSTMTDSAEAELASNRNTSGTHADEVCPAASLDASELSVPDPLVDYYEILQISRNADLETIHRVYRIMATRFHPDNQRTGNLQKFLMLNEAYRVLSDPAQRNQYDAAQSASETKPLPIFGLNDFVDGVAGETNRRLGILSLLYHRRRISECRPGLAELELEKRMFFPREYLQFTLWYLRTKGYIAQLQDNSDYAITALGVEFVESNAAKNKVIRKLLTCASAAPDATTTGRNPAVAGRRLAIRTKPSKYGRRVKHTTQKIPTNSALQLLCTAPPATRELQNSVIDRIRPQLGF